MKAKCLLLWLPLLNAVCCWLGTIFLCAITALRDKWANFWAFFGHFCYWKHFVFYQIHVFWNQNNESTILVFIMGLFFFVSSETGSQCQKGSGYIFSKSCEILWNFYDPLYPQFQDHLHIWWSNYTQLTNWSIYQSTTHCEKYL